MAREAQSALIHEMGHRIKNALSVVVSIVRLSGHNARSLEQFQRDITSPLTALANTSVMITERGKRSVGFRDLIERELAAFPAEGRTAIEGPPLTLGAGIATYLTLMLHELATNSLKYGALSDPGGRIRLAWTTEREEFGYRVFFHWTETSAKPVPESSDSGFRTVLLTKI